MPPKMKTVRFMLQINVTGLLFNPPRPSGITIQRSGTRAQIASLRPLEPDDDPGRQQGGMLCSITRNYRLSETQFRFIESLNCGNFNPWQHYPQDLRENCERIRLELSREARRFIDLLAWFFNASDLHGPFQNESMSWNTKGNSFHNINLPGLVRVLFWNSVIWHEKIEPTFVSLWKGKSDEPLSHELFREAGSLLSSAPRSALLMLASALETGVKSYISQRAPDTQWLLTEMQSPPIQKMLRKYVPKIIPALTRDLSHWSGLKTLFDRVEKMFGQRNHLAHRGNLEITDAQLFEYKKDVSDILYVLDFLNGEQWAINNIRPETCQALKWNDPKPHVYVFKG